jgi:hypothetical protein
MRQNHEWLRQTSAQLRQFGILPHPFCVSLRQPLAAVYMSAASFQHGQASCGNVLRHYAAVAFVSVGNICLELTSSHQAQN